MVKAGKAGACAALALFLCGLADARPLSCPDESDTAHALFLRRMGEKAGELGLTAAYYENASGLTKKSRVSASDLLKIGLAAANDPTLARIWAATNRTVSVGGPHARQERLVHGYTTLKGFAAFVRKYPFLGGKGGSLSYKDLSVRTHVILTEVAGTRLLIALAGQLCSDDPFALDLEICARTEAMLTGKAVPAAPGLAALERNFGGYAFATLDGRIRCESLHARRPQVPASTTKIMTALCCLDVVKDVSDKLTVRARDIVGGSGYACHDGDEITFEDALYSMMLPSSNTLAESVATAAGARLLPARDADKPKPSVSGCVRWTKRVSDPADRYCGWPTLAEVRPGELGLVFSGNRDTHVCPWGEVRMKRSADGGETWSASETVVNGPLDDRDAGITRLANGDLVLVWFTSTAFHDYVEQGLHKKFKHIFDRPEYRLHWNKMDKTHLKDELGSFSMRSADGGRTWEPKVRIPASAPHGCVQLKDGRLLVAGGAVIAESTDFGRSWHELAKLEPTPQGFACEAHLVEGEDGVLRYYARRREWLVACESADGGRTWTPQRDTKIDGSHNPPFLSRLADGRVLLTFGRRQDGKTGVYARIGDRNGSLASFERAADITLYLDGDSDLGYPSTVQLADGTLVTAFYAHFTGEEELAQLVAVKWDVSKTGVSDGPSKKETDK